MQVGLGLGPPRALQSAGSLWCCSDSACSAACPVAAGPTCPLLPPPTHPPTARSEVVGRNCRFLQGPGTDPATVEQLRQALASDPPRPITVTLLNYKKPAEDGSQQPFFNSLHIAPLRDAGGCAWRLAEFGAMGPS